MTEPLIECSSLVRIYRTGKLEVQALQGLDLRVERGEFIALVGASGSGKSTLLGVLSGLDTPSAGSVRVAGRELAGLTRRELLAYRRDRRLRLAEPTAQSAAAPHGPGERRAAADVHRHRRRARRTRAGELLETMGVAYCRDRTPGRLSGGEQQRVAIAVALANSPAVLLADEPTGELDTDSSRTVLDALRSASAVHGVTTLIVTHDEGVSGQVRRTVAIRDGRIATETHRPAQRIRGADPEGPEGRESAEYAVIDRSGRVQLPPEFTEPLGIRDLVKLTHEPGHVGVWPDAPDGGVGESAPATPSRDEDEVRP